MPAVAREISIVYGAVTIGGTSDDYYLHDIHEIEQDYQGGRLRATVIVAPQTSAANFASKCATLEAEFRKPNQDLTVTMGGQAMLSWSHSSNTGFLARPSIRKPGSPIDTARTRLYEVEVEVGFPADLTGKDGLVTYSLRVARSGSGYRALTLTGSYTAKDANAAVAQYEAEIDGEITTITTALTGTWERSKPEFYERDDENKRCNFLRTHREIGYNQASGTLDHAAIVDHTIVVTRAVIALENGPDARAPVDLIVFFDADIAEAQTTDLKGFYEGTIRPYMLSLARAAAPAGIWRTRDEPEYDYATNHIRARVTCQGAQIPLIFQSIQVETLDLPGLELWGVYAGKPYGRVAYQGPRRYLRTTRERTMRIGAVNIPRLRSRQQQQGHSVTAGTPFGVGATGGVTVTGGGGSPFGVGATGGVTLTGGGGSGSGGAGLFGVQGSAAAPGWYQINYRASTSPVVRGDIPDSVHAVYEEAERVEEFAEIIAAGGAPAGGGGDASGQSIPRNP